MMILQFLVIPLVHNSFFNALILLALSSDFRLGDLHAFLKAGILLFQLWWVVSLYTVFCFSCKNWEGWLPLVNDSWFVRGSVSVVVSGCDFITTCV